MTATNVNGTRKSLAEQIDRLDSILDGMADGLQGAVADAVRQAVTAAVQEAVRGVLAELLTNPDLLALLRGTVPAATPHAPEAPPRETLSVAQRVRRAAAWVGRKARSFSSAIISGAAGACAVARGGWRRLRVLRRFKGPLLSRLQKVL
jgi:hypothetical protein